MIFRDWMAKGPLKNNGFSACTEGSPSPGLDDRVVTNRVGCRGTAFQRIARRTSRDVPSAMTRRLGYGMRVALFAAIGGGSVLTSQSHAAEIPATETFPALGAPADPKVSVPWNRFYDVAGLQRILRELAAAFPDQSELVTLGTSFEGREILALVVTNEKTGSSETKPAMYIDGNIHGNEVQAGEVVAYTAWYLLESYGKIERVTQLLDTKAFYLVPTINPDGRDAWFHSAANPHNFRGGMVPVDNDGDGLFDEDPPNDVDGDGYLTQMRIADPWGRHEKHPDYPDLLVKEVARDERGGYTLLGWEGIDDDGDGRINEDGPGGYDPNRNWPWRWQPESIQRGAHDYPLSLPETRAVADFVLAHPNIAATQSYHNAAGMILRGPGQESARFEQEDEELHAFIGERGESILPHYDSNVLWKDLYTVWGGEVEWFYSGLGIVSFTNEMWTEENLYRGDLGPDGEGKEARFLRHLLLDQGVTKWHEVDHPDLGKIEIGGTAKEFGRVPPSFLLEEELHRNMAFTLYHAECMPLVAIEEVIVEPLDNGVSRLRVAIDNHGIIPTRLANDVKNGITAKNAVTLDGITALAAGWVEDPIRKQTTWQKGRADRLLVETFPGLRRTWVEFLVSGSGTGTVRVEAARGGRAERGVRIP